MKRKNQLFSLLAVVFSAMFLITTTSCNQSKLQITVSLTNAKCPIDMGLAGSIESIELGDENVIYTIKLNEQFSNIEAMEQNKEDIARSIVNSMSNEESAQELMKILVEENFGIEYVFIGNKSGQKMNIELLPEQINAILSTPTTAHEKLISIVKATKVQLPMKVDVVTTMKDMIIDGDDVIYIYDIDENQVKMSDIDIDVIKANAIANLSNVISDAAAGQFFQTVMDDKKNVRYRYFGDKTGTELEYVISLDELLGIRSNAN